MRKIFTLLLIFSVFPLISRAQSKLMDVETIDGRVIEYEVSDLSRIRFKDDPWETIGMGQYTEGILSDMFYWDYYGDMSVTWDVEIQENNETPGLYRMKNPYKDYSYNFVFDFVGGSYDTSQNYYVEINACDPDAVYIPMWQDTGLYCGIYSEFSIGSLAAYRMEIDGYTLEQQKALGNCGTLRDGVITFPEETVLLIFATTCYEANVNGNFRLVLPQ